MGNKIKVTVGICAKNAEDFIKDTIDNIINQDFPHELMEVIFCIDFSEDGTLSIVRDSLPRMDMPVKVYSSREYLGIGKARNVVLNNARGDYILWVDDDFTLQRAFVKNRVKSIECSPNAAMVGVKCAIELDSNIISVLNNMIYRASNFKYAKEAPAALPGTGGSICRTEALRQVGGFDEKFKKAGEDKDIAFRIKAAGWRLLCNDQDTIYHRDCIRTWKRLWNKHLIHGYASHLIHHKNEGVFTLYNKTPPAALIEGLSLFSVAYKLTGRKIAFLVPFFLYFISTAFTFGYFKGHLDKYGHF